MPEQPPADAAWVVHCRTQGVRPLGVARGALAEELAATEVSAADELAMMVSAADEDWATAPVKARAKRARTEEAYMAVVMDEGRAWAREERGRGGLYTQLARDWDGAGI